MELFWHWLQVVSGAILVGSFLFPSARARKLACGAAFVFLLSGIGLLWLQTLAARAQGPAAVNVEELIAFATQTHYGHVWLVRQALVIAIIIWLAVASKSDAVTPLALGLLAQATLAAAGHSFAAEEQWIAVPLHAVHVAASSLWLGGLGVLVWTAYAAPEVELLGALRRFSRLALALMAAILASGAVIAIVHVGRWPALFGTPSGQTLLLKLALIAAVLAVAGNLRWRLLPALDSWTRGAALPRFAIWLTLEWLLGLAVMGLAVTLATMPPARHQQIVWPFAFRLTWALPSLMVPAYPDTYRYSTVSYDALSIANGERLFQAHCTLCHGVNANGDGELAKTLPKAPADLTAPRAADHTAGDRYGWITHGIPQSGMPPFASLTEDERWDLVNFVHTLAMGYRARPLRTTIAPERPWLAAPDFSYVTRDDASGSLSEFREQSALLLVFFRPCDARPRLAQLDALSERLARLDVRILAVPDLTPPDTGCEVPSLRFAVVRDGVEEALASYRLFRHTLENARTGGREASPVHMEFLIDRFGYLRARWLPEDVQPGWRDEALLLGEAARLQREPRIAPPPDPHLH